MDAHEGGVAGDDVSVGGEGRTDGEESGHLNLSAVDLGVDEAVFLEVCCNVAIFGSSGSIEEDGVELLEGDAVLIDFGEGEGLRAGIAAPNENGSGLFGFGILPLAGGDVEGRDGGDVGVAEELVEAFAWGGADGEEGLELGVGDHEVGVEIFVGCFCGVVKCAFKAHLDKNQEVCKGNSGDRDKEPSFLSGQLKPSERNPVEWPFEGVEEARSYFSH